MEEVEMWVPVNGYQGIYEVSSLGKVRSVDRITTRLHSGKVVTQPLKGVELRAHLMKIGYCQVNLSKEGEVKARYVHDLVAEHFIGPRPPKHQVCHGDGNGANNRKSNLRYGTPINNAEDRKKHGTDAVGENNPSNKYSAEVIRSVRDALKSRTNAEVGRMFNMHPATVSGIKLGTNWSHLD